MTDTTIVYIEADERYPDYLVADSWEAYNVDHTYEVDDETLARWAEAAAAYEVRHNEIRAFVHSHWKNHKRIDREGERP